MEGAEGQPWTNSRSVLHGTKVKPQAGELTSRAKLREGKGMGRIPKPHDWTPLPKGHTDAVLLLLLWLLPRCLEPVETSTLEKGRCAPGVPARFRLGALSASQALSSRCGLTGELGHGSTCATGEPHGRPCRQ